MIQAKPPTRPFPEPSGGLPAMDSQNVAPLRSFPFLMIDNGLKLRPVDDKDIFLVVGLFTACGNDLGERLNLADAGEFHGGGWITTNADDSEAAIDFVLKKLVETIRNSRGSLSGMNAALEVAHCMLGGWITAHQHPYLTIVPVYRSRNGESAREILDDFTGELREEFRRRIHHKPDPCSFCPK